MTFSQNVKGPGAGPLAFLFMIKDLPSIETSVAFWASVATLFSASGAWFTFLVFALKAANDTKEGVLNLIQGIEAEIALAEQWALGEVGYPQSKTKEELRQEYSGMEQPKQASLYFRDTYSKPRHKFPLHAPSTAECG